jgi:hypothetical protein
LFEHFSIENISPARHVESYRTEISLTRVSSIATQPMPDILSAQARPHPRQHAFPSRCERHEQPDCDACAGVEAFPALLLATFAAQPGAGRAERCEAAFNSAASYSSVSRFGFLGCRALPCVAVTYRFKRRVNVPTFKY